MKIGPLETQPAAVDRVAPAAGERKADAGKAGSAASGPSASATVALSSTAAALTQEAAGEVSFDQAKVDRIAQAIRDGNYQVNAEAIADKLIGNAQELLGKTGG
jgi:negative regulator of flagellin synthesis FlgM